MPQGVTTARTLQASLSRAGGAAATTGTALDLRTDLALTVLVSVTNGATGPTIGCSWRVEVSNDNTVWRTFAEGLAPTTASLTFTWPVYLGAEIMWARTVFVGNTAQAVTVEALGHELTSVV